MSVCLSLRERVCERERERERQRERDRETKREREGEREGGREREREREREYRMHSGWRGCAALSMKATLKIRFFLSVFLFSSFYRMRKE